MAAGRDRPRSRRVREQVVVYLEPRDRELLEDMVDKTGLSRTELLRRGLWHFANEALGENKPGWSLDYLIATARDDGFPPDVAERHDYYLYGGGYEKWLKQKQRKVKRKRASPR